jgi:hypothetical protein
MAALTGRRRVIIVPDKIEAAIPMTTKETKFQSMQATPKFGA